MKKIIIVIGVCSQIFLWGCGDNGEETMFILDDIKGEHVMGATVDTPIAVVEVLKDKKKLDIVKLENIEGESNSNMMITVTEFPEEWTVLVKTRTAIPSYSCEFSMDKQGEPVQSDYVIKKCGFNK